MSITFDRIAHPGTSCAQLAATVKLMETEIAKAERVGDFTLARLLDSLLVPIWNRYALAAERILAKVESDAQFAAIANAYHDAAFAEIVAEIEECT